MADTRPTRRLTGQRAYCVLSDQLAGFSAPTSLCLVSGLRWYAGPCPGNRRISCTVTHAHTGEDQTDFDPRLAETVPPAFVGANLPTCCHKRCKRPVAIKRNGPGPKPRRHVAEDDRRAPRGILPFMLEYHPRRRSRTSREYLVLLSIAPFVHGTEGAQFFFVRDTLHLFPSR